MHTAVPWRLFVQVLGTGLSLRVSRTSTLPTELSLQPLGLGTLLKKVPLVHSLGNWKFKSQCSHGLNLLRGLLGYVTAWWTDGRTDKRPRVCGKTRSQQPGRARLALLTL